MTILSQIKKEFALQAKRVARTDYHISNVRFAQNMQISKVVYLCNQPDVMYLCMTFLQIFRS